MNKPIPPHLRWACRRGMLELDLLLGNYLEHAYLELAASEQALFEQLLACNDQELFMWLTGKEASSDPELQAMVEKVRLHARSSR